MTRSDQRKAIQRILGVKEDGKFGPVTETAFAMLNQRFDLQSGVIRMTGKASSFADPADIRRFKECKAKGKSDKECFKVGDNGIGVWGDSTTLDVPSCAIPRDDWQHLGKTARRRLIKVRANGREVVCELRDTMPWRKNIKNNAIIDLNPAAVKAIGLKPPILVNAEWEWV